MESFNPSRGIAIIQTVHPFVPVALTARFNPSRGIAIIQTARLRARALDIAVSIPHAG